MKTELALINSDANPWIKHFQQQADKGGSARSSFNKHYILLNRSNSANKSHTPKTESNSHKEVEVPPIVSPIKQSLDQAKEEAKRDQKGKKKLSCELDAKVGKPHKKRKKSSFTTLSNIFKSQNSDVFSLKNE